MATHTHTCCNPELKHAAVEKDPCALVHDRTGAKQGSVADVADADVADALVVEQLSV